MHRSLSLAFLLIAGPALAQTPPSGPAPARPTVTPLDVPDLPLGQAVYPGGKSLRLNLGLGSAAFRSPSDPPGVIWTLTDRGPNIDCGDAPERITGLTADVICAGDKSAKSFPLPGFAPSIVKLQVGPGDAVAVLERIPLKGRSGKAITGLPNPLKSIRMEAAYDSSGRRRPEDPSGVDPEGLVRLSDGSFWIAEEYGSSILEVAPDGTVRRRLVPAGLEAEYAGADYEIAGLLPAIIAKRQLNRGLEGLALSPDGARLFALMQSPLANPDTAAFAAGANARLWRIERGEDGGAFGRVTGQFLYPMDAPATFRADAAAGAARRQSDVRMSEVVALSAQRLIVLERINLTTKLYLVDLASGTPVPAAFDDPARSPSLEQLSPADLAAQGLRPLEKTLLLDSDDLGGMLAQILPAQILPAKVEGVAVMSERELILVTDSDFGVEGAATRMLRVTFAEPVLR